MRNILYLVCLLSIPYHGIACDLEEKATIVAKESQRLLEDGVLNEDDILQRAELYSNIWAIHAENLAIDEPVLNKLSIDWVCSVLETSIESMEMVEQYHYLENRI